MTRIDGLNPLTTSRTLAGQSSNSIDPAGSDGQTSDTSALGRQDAVAVSARGRVMAVAAAAVKQAPDVRAAQVAALRAALADGTYSSSARDIADRLLGSGGLS
jgi:flagellar biosynthesis anti-sigma factor FlgM